MDAVAEVLPPPLPVAADAPARVVDPHTAERRRELLLDALKMALAEGGEHRLFRAGRLDGLFPSKLGDSGEVARQALAAGLIEHVRTEVKGKFIFEWVRATPLAVAYVHQHDSPKAVLRELRDILGETRAGIPLWMDQARIELRTMSQQFELRANEVIKRLSSLADRVDAALRRAEAAGPLNPVGTPIVPWAIDALSYLDWRQESGLGQCPLSELFQSLKHRHPGLTVPAFHDGLRRLHENRAVRLSPGSPNQIEPEFTVVADGQLMAAVSR